MFKKQLKLLLFICANSKPSAVSVATVKIYKHTIVLVTATLAMQQNIKQATKLLTSSVPKKLSGL